jgi:hypothetical protein
MLSHHTPALGRDPHDPPRALTLAPPVRRFDLPLRLIAVLIGLAGAALTIIALIAPAPFVGSLFGPVAIAAAVVIYEEGKARADRRRRARRGGYLL